MKFQDKTRTITSVKAKAPFILALRWSDGSRAELDLTALLRDKAFKSLRDPGKFTAARVGEWGHGVAWPSGAELSAETRCSCCSLSTPLREPGRPTLASGHHNVQVGG